MQSLALTYVTVATNPDFKLCDLKNAQSHSQAASQIQQCLVLTAACSISEASAYGQNMARLRCLLHLEARASEVARVDAPEPYLLQVSMYP